MAADTATLLWSAGDGLTLPQALAEAGGTLASCEDGPTALLYSPTRCRLGRVDAAGEVIDARGHAIDLDDVFEARAFSTRAELRWLHEAGGKGRAVLLAEKTPVSPTWNVAGEPLRAYGTIDQTYLLWGEARGDAPAEDWSRLVEARIGAIEVPVAVDKGQRVELWAREYLTADDQGNVSVVEERLLGLRPAGSGRPAGPGGGEATERPLSDAEVDHA